MKIHAGSVSAECAASAGAFECLGRVNGITNASMLRCNSTSSNCTSRIEMVTSICSEQSQKMLRSTPSRFVTGGNPGVASQFNRRRELLTHVRHLRAPEILVQCGSTTEDFLALSLAAVPCSVIGCHNSNMLYPLLRCVLLELELWMHPMPIIPSFMTTHMQFFYQEYYGNATNCMQIYAQDEAQRVVYVHICQVKKYDGQSPSMHSTTHVLSPTSRVMTSEGIFRYVVLLMITCLPIKVSLPMLLNNYLGGT